MMVATKPAALLSLSRRIGLLTVLLVQWWLLVDGSWYRSLWVDEAYSLEQASKSLPDILLTIAPDHTPLYYLLLSISIRPFGQSEFALRIVSGAAVLAGAAAVYWLGRQVRSSSIGYLAAAFWA